MDTVIVSAGRPASWPAPGLDAALRVACADQDVFIGGSALAVRPGAVESFFPHVYNEDWLFLAPYLARRQVAAAGIVEHQPRNPYGPLERVEQEEFGDVVGEGLLGQLHLGPLEPTLTTIFWSDFLARRAEFIEATEKACWRSGRRDAGPALGALATARAALGKLTPDGLADYVRAWAADLIEWRGYLSRIERRDDLSAALLDHGVPARSFDTHTMCGRR